MESLFRLLSSAFAYSQWFLMECYLFALQSACLLYTSLHHYIWNIFYIKIASTLTNKCFCRFILPLLRYFVNNIVYHRDTLFTMNKSVFNRKKNDKIASQLQLFFTIYYSYLYICFEQRQTIKSRLFFQKKPAYAY